MQFDMFALEAEPIIVAPEPPPAAPAAPAEPPELDAWTRETQRIYLTNLAREIPRHQAAGDAHRVHACTHNARHVLMKLNGLGGQW